MKEQKKKTVKFLVEKKNPDGTRRWYVEEWDPKMSTGGPKTNTAEKGEDIP